MGGKGSGKKPREYPPDVVALVCGMYADGMTVAEIRHAAPKGYRVQTILERYLPTRRPAVKRDQSAEKNHMWRGDEASYKAIHLRLGAPGQHACVDCRKHAEEWSYCGNCGAEQVSEEGVPYCAHREHYTPRCVKCHREYDYKGRRPNGQWCSSEEVMPHV